MNFTSPFTHLRVPNVPTFGVFFILVGLAYAYAQPQLIPLQNLPPGLRQYTGYVEGESGTYLSTAEGVLSASAGAWHLDRLPNGEEPTLVLPLGVNLLVGGHGFCYALTNGRYTNLGIDDELYSGACVQDEAVVVGRRGIYVIRSGKPPERVLEITGKGNRNAFIVNQNPVVFAGDKAYSYINHALVKVDDYPWARGVEVTSLQKLGDGDLFAATSKGLFRVRNGAVTKVCDKIWHNIISKGLISAYIFGDKLAITTFFGGVTCCSIANSEVLWSVPTDQLGGSVYFTQIVGDGLLVGHSSGLSYLPRPDLYSVADFPIGDFLFSSVVNNQPRIGLTTGVFALDGQRAPSPDKVFSLFAHGDDELVVGSLGRVYKGAVVYQVGGREVTSIVRTKDGIICAQPQGLSRIIDNDYKPIAADVTANSLAPGDDESVLVGTSRGIHSIGPNGLTFRWGSGHSNVFSTPVGTFGSDADGTIFDQQGNVVIRLLDQPAVALAAAKDRPIYVLVRHDGEYSVYGVRSGVAKPLAVPIPSTPRAIFHDGNGFVLVVDGKIVRALDPQDQKAPVLDCLLSGTLASAAPDRLNLPDSRSDLTITVPGRLLDLWGHHSYSFRLGDGPWEQLPERQTTRVPSMRWGNNHLTLRVESAGLFTQKDFVIFQPLPLPLRWPMLIGYVFILAAAGYGLHHIRVRRLQSEAKRLSGMVDQRTAELHKAVNAREEFFSTLSHEIRNPLNGVVGLCEILEESPAGTIAPRQRLFVRTLTQCADQLRTIIDDVLDFTRIDRGDVQINEEVFNVHSAIEGSVRTVDVQLEKCTIEAEDAGIWLRGDIGKIRQILINLTSNALKYSVPTGARIAATTTLQNNGKVRFTVSVMNTGPTIPAEELDKIFVGFQRGRDALARKIPGSGIGLSVSKRMANAMGGDLTVSSKDGLTEFKFDIELNPGVPAEVQTPRTEIRHSPSRALAIEDESYNRMVLGNILEQLGYEVDWAEDGKTAMERVASASYDLILTDYMLPDMTGVEVAKKILARLTPPKPPIIAVTAYSTPEKIAEAKEAGITGYVTKPLSRRKLEAAITSSLPLFSARTIMTPPQPANLDFAPLLRLQNGRQKIAEYAIALEESWLEIVESLAPDILDDESRKRVHAFRTRLLVVNALDAAEQAALLEDACGCSDKDSARRIAGVLATMVSVVANSSRSAAFRSD